MKLEYIEHPKKCIEKTIDRLRWKVKECDFSLIEAVILVRHLTGFSMKRCKEIIQE